MSTVWAKTLRAPAGSNVIVAALALLSSAFALCAAPAKTQTGTETQPAATNAPPTIPQSVFVTPVNPEEGRDPFFPKSIRLFAAQVPKDSRGPAVGAKDIVLNGILLREGRRLAVINNRAFGEGDALEVTTPKGRILVRCVEIKDESVMIEAGGVRRELRLGSTF